MGTTAANNGAGTAGIPRFTTSRRSIPRLQPAATGSRRNGATVNRLKAKFPTVSKPLLRGMMVPRRGLEPPLLAEHGPEPCASTNSAIWATGGDVSGQREPVNAYCDTAHNELRRVTARIRS